MTTGGRCATLVVVRIIHKQAEQGHAVPSHILTASGPFGVYTPEKAEDEQVVDEFPYGATAQNDMVGIGLYTCNLCGSLVRETELSVHRCEEQ